MLQLFTWTAVTSPPRDLADRHNTLDARPCRGWPDPGALDFRDDRRIPLIASALLRTALPRSSASRLRRSSACARVARLFVRGLLGRRGFFRLLLLLAPFCRPRPCPLRPSRQPLSPRPLSRPRAVPFPSSRHRAALVPAPASPARAFPGASRSSSRLRSISAGSGLGGPCSSTGAGSGSGTGSGAGGSGSGFGGGAIVLSARSSTTVASMARVADRRRLVFPGEPAVDRSRHDSRMQQHRQRDRAPAPLSERLLPSRHQVQRARFCSGGCVMKPTLLAPARCRMVIAPTTSP